MFRTARRIAAVALIAGVALPAANASAGNDYVLELGGVKVAPAATASNGNLQITQPTSATPRPPT